MKTLVIYACWDGILLHPWNVIFRGPKFDAVPKMWTKNWLQGLCFYSIVAHPEIAVLRREGWMWVVKVTKDPKRVWQLTLILKIWMAIHNLRLRLVYFFFTSRFIFDSDIQFGLKFVTYHRRQSICLGRCQSLCFQQEPNGIFSSSLWVPSRDLQLSNVAPEILPRDPPGEHPFS